MKQNHTSILRRTLSAVLLLLLSTLAWAQDYDFESGVIRYSINEDKESVTCKGFYRNLRRVVIPSTVRYKGKKYRVTSIGMHAFSFNRSLTSISLPAGVTSIGNHAFNGCSSLASISLPEGLTSIGGSAFFGCSSLTSVSFPDGLTSIGESAFYGCSSLTSIDIPSSVTSIGYKAFCICTSLVTVVCRAEAVPVCGMRVFGGINTAEGTLYVPASAIEDYKAADQWNCFGTTLPLEDNETGIDTPTSSQESGTSAAAGR